MLVNSAGEALQMLKQRGLRGNKGDVDVSVHRLGREHKSEATEGPVVNPTGVDHATESETEQDRDIENTKSDRS